MNSSRQLVCIGWCVILFTLLSLGYCIPTVEAMNSCKNLDVFASSGITDPIPGTAENCTILCIADLITSHKVILSCFNMILIIHYQILFTNSLSTNPCVLIGELWRYGVSLSCLFRRFWSDLFFTLVCVLVWGADVTRVWQSQVHACKMKSDTISQ